MMRLLPNDQRRAALSAGLLASNHNGEVIAAARALCGLLKKGDLDPATVVSAGLMAVSSPPVAPTANRYSCHAIRPMSERARMARYSPSLNDWERGFLDDIIGRRNLSERQESTLRSILAKAERGDA